MRAKFLRMVMVVAAAVLTGCASIGEQAQIEAGLYTRVHMNRYPVIVTEIDGESTPTFRPIWVEPGRKRLALAAPPVRGFKLPVRQEVTFEFKPCTRYYFGAQRQNSLTQAWEFVVDHEEPIAGCTPGVAKAAALDQPPKR